MERAPEYCPVCGVQEREGLVQVKGWQVVSCYTCGLGMLDPRPSRSELVSLYDKKYCDERFCDGGSDDETLQKRLSLESSRLRLVRKFKQGGRVLDIGCGFGYFLAACRARGYAVHGVDFSGHAIEHAQDRLQIPVTVGALDEVQLETKAFDVVTMWHSLEHTPEPSAALALAKDCLRVDGILVVDVPNYLGTDAARYGLTWTGWDPPYHLWHFTPAALSRLLAKHGLEVIKVKTYHSEFIKEKLQRYFLLRPVARMISQCYSGHSVAMVARIRP